MKVHFRLLGVLSVVVLALIWGLVAMSGTVAFFLRPSEVQDQHVGKRLRIGGVVANFDDQEFPYKFVLKDDLDSIQVTYRGVLPDLFRLDQVAVAEGVLQGDMLFWADTVLAKHDEEYVPYRME